MNSEFGIIGKLSPNLLKLFAMSSHRTTITKSKGQGRWEEKKKDRKETSAAPPAGNVFLWKTEPPVSLWIHLDSFSSHPAKLECWAPSSCRGLSAFPSGKVSMADPLLEGCPQSEMRKRPKHSSTSSQFISTASSGSRSL